VSDSTTTNLERLIAMAEEQNVVIMLASDARAAALAGALSASSATLPTILVVNPEGKIGLLEVVS
jgi:hypothetical protein